MTELATYLRNLTQKTDPPQARTLPTGRIAALMGTSRYKVKKALGLLKKKERKTPRKNRPSYELTAEHLDWLTHDDQLQRFQTLSLHQRCVLFHR
jgi:hypothetical protein